MILADAQLPAMSLLARLYVQLARHTDGRAGAHQRFWSRVLDLDLSTRPRFRGLDAEIRRRVYLEHRRALENDPLAVTACVRWWMLLYSGVIVGGVAGDFTAATFLLGNPSGSFAVDFAKALCILAPFLIAGALLGTLAARAITSRTGPSKQQLQAFLDDAFARVGVEASGRERA